MVAPDDETIPGRAWMALFVSTLVVFLAVVNISSVNVAFPSIREDFGSTDAELSWIVGAYNLVVGSLLLQPGGFRQPRSAAGLPAGRGDCRVRLDAVCARSGDVVAVATRLVQGVGETITLAASFAVMPEFPPARRSTRSASPVPPVRSVRSSGRSSARC